MIEHSAILITIGPAFLILLAGYVLRRQEWLTKDADKSLMRLQFNVLYPCLILTTILGNPAVSTGRDFIVPVSVGFLNEGIGLLIAFFAAGLFAVKRGRDRQTFSYTIAHFNNGLIPILLVQSLFEGNSTLAVLFVHNLGIELCFWSICLMVLTASFEKSWWKNLINVPLFALLFGLSMNLTGFSQDLLNVESKLISGMVDTLLTGARLIGQCTVPMGLLLSGAIGYEMVRDSFKTIHIGAVAGAVVLRLVVVPACFLMFALLLPVSIELKRVLVIQAAMPCGLLTVVAIHHYKGNAQLATPMTIITTLISIITIPFVISFGFELVGLN